MTEDPTYFIKAKLKTAKTWKFLSRGGESRLRIHALRFTHEKAQEVLANNIVDNPNWDFKLQRISHYV